MSLLAELQAVTDDYIMNRQPVDVYFKSNVLSMKLFSRNSSYPGGKKVKAFLEYASQPAGSYGPKSRLPVDKNEIFTAAFWPYGAYFGIATIDMDDQLMNAGDAAFVDITQGKIRNMEKSIRDAIAAGFYLSNAAALLIDPNCKPLWGLPDLFNPSASFEYGEIMESDMAEWAGKTISVAKTMIYATMQEIRREASIDTTAEGKPDLYITTEELKDAFELALQANVRYSDKKLIDAGFDNILFKSAPVVADGKQADGTVDALNTRYLDVLTHAKRNFTKPVWQSPIDQPDVATCNVRWAGQLVTSHRGAHCRYDSVS